MATVEAFQEQLARIDAATTSIADEIKALKDQIAGAGLSEETENSVLTQLTAMADKLAALGASETPSEPTV